MAEGSSSFETTSGTTDIHAGALQANPTPKRNTAARMMTGLNKWSDANIARPAAASASQTCITHKIVLRLAISASAPAGKVSRKKGSDADVDSNDRKRGDEVSVFITQVAAMSCAETQQPERTLANHRLRKVGLRRAVQIDCVLIRARSYQGGIQSPA